MNKQYYVYILSNKLHTVFYTGVTNNLPKRIYEHKSKLVDGFSKKYNISKLVYYEEFEDVEDAIISEKRIKKWRREWKIDLILGMNPKLKDLSESLL